MRRLLKVLGIAVAVLIAGLVVAVLVAQRMHDGPLGPIAGGPLRAGELVTDPNVDWTAIGPGEIELQLVDPPHSRITGSMVYEGQLYVPCDLGYIWRRVPDTRFRSLLHLIWSVKRWHEDALRDGRAVLRIAGKRYERQAVRVTDPALLAALRSQLEQRASEFFAPAGGLRDIPGDPDAIWFFRLDPRPS